MKELCENLEKIKENNEENYENLLKVLRYISKLGDEDNIDINSEPIQILIDICMNKNPKFTQKFFEKVLIPLDMIENKILFKEKPYLYFFNIYTILKAYETNKDDYKRFSEIIDDISYVFPLSYNRSRAPFRNLHSKLDLIEKTVKSKYYSPNNALSDLLHKTITDAEKDWDEKEYDRLNAMFRLCQSLNRDSNNLKMAGYEIKESVEKSILDDILLLANDDLLPRYEPYYASIMLQKDRYWEIKKALQHVPYYHHKEIFDTYLSNLDQNLFEELNAGKENDSFSKYLEIIFDSDTYHELISKLIDFNRASDCYRNGEKKEAYKILTELSSNRHKEVIDDIIITYPTEENNKITKPESIPKRMLELYHRYGLLGLYYHFDRDKVEEIFGEQPKALTISEFNEKVTNELMRYKTNDTNKILSDEEKTPYVKKKRRFNFLG